jgi:hypothetical protein
LYKNNSQTDFKRKGCGMLGFVKKVFRKFFAIWLWLNLVLCAVGGGVAFYSTVAQTRDWWSGSSSVNGGLVFFGVLIGLVVGFITNILSGGLVATFLNIDDNLEQLKSKICSSI